MLRNLLPIQETDRGSFRDPAGFIFTEDGLIYRAVADSHWPIIQVGLDSGLFPELTAAGDLIETQVVAPDSPEQTRFSHRFAGWRHFLRHRKINWVSYPHEWCFSMLAEAARLQLRLQQVLLSRGFSLKDASAFNVLFEGCHPVFVDVLSVEKPRRLDVWIAYSQFCQMFLFPLLLSSFRNINFRQIFLGSVEGIGVEQAYAILGRRRSLSPICFLDVFVQQFLARRNSKSTRALRHRLDRPAGEAAVQTANLQRLERKIVRLQRDFEKSSPWTDYETTARYSDRSREEKKDFVDQFLKEFAPATLLDLGCNTGTYSRLAAERGCQVVAIDRDHDCVERLFREARSRSLPILPLVMDLAQPSPGLGFWNRERKSFLDRFQCRSVLALALLHHLLVAARLPLPEIRRLLADLTEEFLVIEFIEREDEMFQTLLALREDLYRDLTLESFLKEFESGFELVRRHSLTGTRRHLFVFRKRT